MRQALCLLLASTVVALAGCEPLPQESSSATPPAPTAVGAPTAGPTDTLVPTPAPSPAATADVDGAVETVLDYWGAVQDRDYARAYDYWAGEGAASGQTYEQFAEGFANTAGLTLLLSAPGELGDASGSVTVPVTLTAVANVPNEPDQAVQHFAGTYTLQPTGTGWRISGADIAEVADPELPPPEVSDAATLLQTYFEAINGGEYARAYTCWNNLGQASEQTYAAFRQGLEETGHVAYQLGRPRDGVAAGSHYSEVPVLMVAEQTDGTRQAFCGTYTLRRYNVPPFDQFGWRIERAEMSAIEAVDLDSPEAERLLDEGCRPATTINTRADPQTG